jgi:hypothetical protein
VHSQKGQFVALDGPLAQEWTDPGRCHLRRPSVAVKVPLSYRRKLVYTDGYEVYASFFPVWQHRISDKRDGRTSRIEGANTLFRARVSGLVRRSCGVCRARVLDVWQRFLLVKHQHNCKCQQRQQSKEREQITTLKRP